MLPLSTQQLHEVRSMAAGGWAWAYWAGTLLASPLMRTVGFVGAMLRRRGGAAAAAVEERAALLLLALCVQARRCCYEVGWSDGWMVTGSGVRCRMSDLGHCS
jgi:hypothetical protein